MLKLRKLGKRAVITLFAVCLVAIAIQLLTYSLWAIDRAPLAGLRQLDCYERLSTFDFIVVDAESWAGLTPGQQERLKAEVAAMGPELYVSREAVPTSALRRRPLSAAEIEERERYYSEAVAGGAVSAESLEDYHLATQSGKVVVGYENGLDLTWREKGAGLFWCMSFTVGPLGDGSSERRKDLLVWLLCRWVRVPNLLHK